MSYIAWWTWLNGVRSCVRLLGCNLVVGSWLLLRRPTTTMRRPSSVVVLWSSSFLSSSTIRHVLSAHVSYYHKPTCITRVVSACDSNVRPRGPGPLGLGAGGGPGRPRRGAGGGAVDRPRGRWVLGPLSLEPHVTINTKETYHALLNKCDTG